jgi:hypothetical protein
MVKNEVYKSKEISRNNLHHLISERSLLFFIKNTNFNKNKYYQLENRPLSIFYENDLPKAGCLKK